MQSYLELISLYKDLLARKREELRLDKERLENGLTKIAQASAQVSPQYDECWPQVQNFMHALCVRQVRAQVLLTWTHCSSATVPYGHR